jgi:mannosyltransferase
VTARPAGTKPALPAAGPAGTPDRRWTLYAGRYVPVLVPAVAATVSGLWGLSRSGSMGNDEVATRWAALLSLHELGHLVRHVDAVHGLYYLLMHAWVVVGATPAVLRIPSVLAMAAGAALVAILARRLTGSGWAALFAGLIMALTPTITYYAQTARSYALVYACVALATLVMLRALDVETGPVPSRASRYWIGYAALIALSGYLNEMALLVLAAHAVTVLLARYGQRTCWHWAAAAAGGTVLVLPLLAISVGERTAIAFLARPGIADIKTLFHDYFGASIVVGALLLLCAVVALLPIRPAWPRSPVGAPSPVGPTPQAAAPAQAEAEPNPAWWRGGITLPSVALPLLVLPALLLLAESRIGTPLYIDRYVLYGEAGAALLAGAGVYRLGQLAVQYGRRRELLVVPGVIVCVLALALQIGTQQRIRTPESRAYDFGGPSLYIAAHARPGDGILYFGTLFRKAELGYPADYRNVTDFAEAVTPRQAGDFRGTDKSFGQTLPLMLGYQRIWVVGARPSVTLPPGLLRQDSATLASKFRLIDTRVFRGITVTLWQRR